MSSSVGGNHSPRGGAAMPASARPVGNMPAAANTFRVKTAPPPAVSKPSLQYLLAVPSHNDSDVILRHLHDQYINTVQQYVER